MLARLLRSTIGALNTSSRTVLEATNVRKLKHSEDGLLRAEGKGGPSLGILGC